MQRPDTPQYILQPLGTERMCAGLRCFPRRLREKESLPRDLRRLRFSNGYRESRSFQSVQACSLATPRRYWDVAGMTLILYISITIPFEIAFSNHIIQTYRRMAASPGHEQES